MMKLIVLERRRLAWLKERDCDTLSETVPNTPVLLLRHRPEKLSFVLSTEGKTYTTVINSRELR